MALHRIQLGRHKDLTVIRYIDILIDGKFVKDKLDPKLHWRGSTNQRVIDVKQSRDDIVLYTKA